MKLLYAIIIGMAVLAGGCASTKAPIGVDKTATPAVQAVQAAINEGRIAIGASAGVIAQHKRDGLITAAERDAFVAKLEEYRDELKDAERLKDLGDLRAASKAGATKALILLLQHELAAKAREGK
jgi:hypothetical protein